MADNTVLNLGSGGDTTRTKDRTTYKTPVALIDVGGSSAEALIGDSTNAMPVGGLAAENAAAAGNPVLAGGRYDSTPRTLGNGDVGGLAVNAAGQIIVAVGVGATDLGKAEDAAHVSGDVGIQALAVRTDTPANKSGANGDYEPLQISAGRLWTSATITSLIPGTTATSLGKAEDAAHSTGDTGVMALAVRTDTPANRSGADGDYEPLQVSGGRVWSSAVITAALPTGTNVIGDVGNVPRTSGGLAVNRQIDLDEAKVEIKSSAGQIYGLHVINLHTAPIYVKFYNAAAASVTVGTTTPFLTFAVPAQSDGNGGGFNLTFSQGLEFSTGITVVALTGVADSDTTGPAANKCVANFFYK